jgi:hypothetical protein
MAPIDVFFGGRDRVLLLPPNHGMTDEEQDYVIDHLRASAAGKRAG